MPGRDVTRDPGQQRWKPDQYQRCAPYVPELGRALIDELDPRPGENVLDLGCGDGALTAALAARGCTVVGVDSSAEFVAAASERGLDAVLADARSLDHPRLLAGSFDAVLSNAVLHWIPQAAEVAAAVRRVVRPGGRFVGELGGAGNVGAVRDGLYAALARRGIDAAARDPWYFPAAVAYRQVLEAVGWDVRSAKLFPRSTPVPGALQDWLETFAGAFVADLDAAQRRSVFDEVAQAAAPALRDASGAWTVDYVRLRFSAVAGG